MSKLKLVGGRISVEDRSRGGRTVAAVESFEFEFDLGADPSVWMSGTGRVGAVSFLERRVADSGTAAVTIRPYGIEVREIRLPFPGGEVRGIAKIESAPGWPFQAEFHSRDIELVEVARGVEAPAGDIPVELLAGTADAVMRLQGFAEAAGDARARIVVTSQGVRAKLAGGRGSLRLDEQGAVVVEEAGAILDLVRGELLLTAGGVRSGRVWVKSAGRIGRDGALDLNTRLYAAGDLGASIERSAGGPGGATSAGAVKFLWLPGTDWHYHDFRLGGSASQPLADFWNSGRAVPIPDLLDTLFTDATQAAAAPAG